MLLPPDATLVLRETTLTGIATLLDPEGFAMRLRDASSREDVCSARITYVKYVPGQKCVVGYEVRVGSEVVPVYARAYPMTAQRELQKPRNRNGLPGILGSGRFVLEDCAAVISVFPNDRHVKGLPGLQQASLRRHWLSEALPRHPELWEGRIEHLAYKPERRYVARLCGQGTAIVLKLHDQNGYGAAGIRLRAFTSRGVLRLARCLGHSDSVAAWAFEWVPGVSLEELLAAGQVERDTIARVGTALAELHAQEPPNLPRRTPEMDSVALTRVAESIAFFHPDLADRVRALAHRLASTLESVYPTDRPLHSDFNPTQVLIDGANVTFLDFDRAARGDPALDLGNFLACLEERALAGHLGTEIQSLRRALIQGYGNASDRSLPIRVRLHTAAALLRRMDPFRYWQPRQLRPEHSSCWAAHWPRRVEALIIYVERLLETVDE
jgi:thiamine kinase-like enzyme